MKYYLYLLVLILVSCTDDDQERELISFDELYGYTSSGATSEICNGTFLLHIKNQQGEMKYSDEFGYYVSFSTENTFDCAILGIVCQGDYNDFVGSIVSVTADIHQYTLKHQSGIGGQKL